VGSNVALCLQEVRSQQTLPKLKQYLILYSSIPMAKLALLMETEEASLRTMLICLKNKSYNLQVCTGESACDLVWGWFRFCWSLG
jgi:translation initiation factor 3 subunit L